MTVLDGDLYVFGGSGAKKSVEKYDGNEWSEQKGLQGDFFDGGIVTIN